MELNIDIESAVAQAVAAAMAPEKLEPIINKQVSKAVEDAIEDQFSYRSPFREMLKGKMASAMPTDMEDLGRFSDLVLKIIKAKLHEVQHDAVKQAIESKLDNLLKTLPPTMKLSELVEKLLPDLADDHRRDGDSQPTIIVERSTSVDGYWRLYIDSRSERDAYSCRLQVAFNKEGEAYSLSIGDQKMENTMLIGPAYNADSLLLQIHTCGIAIELDQIDFSDVYYSDENY